LSRRAFFTRWARRLAIPAAVAVPSGAYAVYVEPFRLRVVERDVPVRQLPSELDGLRVAHVSDFHAAQIMSMPYLASAMDQVNALRPDVVCFTGDLTTNDTDFVDPAVAVLERIKAPLFLSLGNHDYAGGSSEPGPVTSLADLIESRVRGCRGMTLLRNRSVVWWPGDRGAGVTFVGIDDLYTDYFDPPRAFAGVERGACPVIALVHNPDGMKKVLPFAPDLILSGHTHGGQVKVPLIGPILLPISDRRYAEGLFKVSDRTHLHVTRGVGYVRQIRFNCRPEIAVLRLVRAA
jgi:predicted MPP superfamily phosphohydrolase